eukprot:m.19167 g.19167  ORF g.19167 m.19167 type:complete len:201 (-) comp6502_c0_seq1:47-649(-)
MLGEKTLGLSFILCCALSSSTFIRSPPPWPQYFSVSFLTDDINNTLYYDYSKNAQRVEHGAGNYECTHFYNSSHPCTLIFPSQGGMYVSIEAEGKCCLDIPDLGTLPPTWPQHNYTYLGVKSVDGVLSNGYSYAGGNHLYWVSMNNDPVLFTFKNISSQFWHYQPRTMVVGPQNNSLFQIPPGCTSKCNSGRMDYRNRFK